MSSSAATSVRDADVLVTGATGFIGGHLARRLAGEGARVTGTGRRVEETTPLDPDARHPYERTKARGEIRMREAAEERGLELAVVRPAMVYGPGSGTWTEALCEAVCRGRRVLVGDGSGHFHPVYVGNLVDALLLCATREEAAGEAFNVCEPPVAWREYAGFFGELCGREPASMPEWLARLMAAADRLPGLELPMNDMRLRMTTNRLVCSAEKARAVLGWTPRVSLEEGLERSAVWLREEGIV